VSELPPFMRGERGTPGAGMHVRIATRGSELALVQAGDIRGRLEALGATAELVLVETQGDREQGPFATLRGQGFFTKAVQEAVLAGDADLAVHSHKALPSAPAPGLEVAAVPERVDARDVLVARPGAHDQAAGGGLPLARRARVGTSAARRRDQFLRLRPDLSLLEMRGNVPSRVRKLREGACDALVLAAAGLSRLGLELGDLVVVPLDPELVVPAPAQGALALEIRRGDDALAALLTELHHPIDGRAVAAERGLMAMLQGGCQLALGAHATITSGGMVHLIAAFEGERAEVAHATAEGAAMLAFDALGRPGPRGDGEDGAP